MSEKQLKANKINAQLGGVKTEEGKVISRFNALTHGILRSSITDYEQTDFKNLYESLQTDFPPQNILEEIILERIAVSYVKMLRVSKAEAEFIKETTSPPEYYIGIDGHEFRATFSADGFEKLSTIYSRYESATENRFYKAVNKLMELKSIQNGKE